MRLTGIARAVALWMLLAAASASAAEASQPRLKFRGKGPVCGCASGLSEADISKAMAARFAGLEGARLDTLDPRPATRDEQRGGVDEAQPR